MTTCTVGIAIASFQMEKLRVSELGELLKATVSNSSSCHLPSTHFVRCTGQSDLCALSHLIVISTLWVSLQRLCVFYDTSRLLLKQRGAADGGPNVPSHLT